MKINEKYIKYDGVFGGGNIRQKHQPSTLLQIKHALKTGKDDTCYRSFQTENIRQQWQILSNRIILFAMCVTYDGIRLCV